MEKKIKTYQLSIIVLILLNASLIGWIWFAKKPQPMRPQEILKRELHLNNEQMESYKSLIAEHRLVADELEKEMRQQKRILFNFSQSDSSKQMVVNKIGQLQVQLDLETYKHFKKVRALCTEEQKLKFEEVLMKVLERTPRPKRPEN